MEWLYWVSPCWLITELGISWCQYFQFTGNHFGAKLKPLIKIQEHKVSSAPVLRNSMLSICISHKQYETSDLPSEKGVKAQKPETLLSNDPWWGELLVSLGLTANLLGREFIPEKALGCFFSGWKSQDSLRQNSACLLDPSVKDCSWDETTH